MNNDYYQKLLSNVKHRFITLVRLDSYKSNTLKESLNGFNYLTLALTHDSFIKTRKDSICIFELDCFEPNRAKEYYLGVVSQKSAVSTFDTRISIRNLTKIYISSFFDLGSKFNNERLKRTFNQRLLSKLEVITLTSATSRATITALFTNRNNHHALKNAADNLAISEEKNDTTLLQEDAENMALKIFGIDLNSKNNYEDRIYEDNIIQYDLNNLEGFTKIAADFTGKVSYVKNQERLTIYHSNKLPLEEMLGVDLIYINEIMNSIVMIQYKMLEREYDDWIFRPNPQMKKEIARMKLPKSLGSSKGYRINSNPFFFKFIKRGKNSLGSSFVISLEHYQYYILTEDAKGPRGGDKIGFNTINGQFLKSNDIISLIRSGYVGTHIEETQALRLIVDEVSKGNKDVVIAWQSSISEI